ncbi:MAG: tRNA pseudouridine(55) synthase TruB [Calditrichaeota bacterium]|nr:MAG: tRNA pseudouridine(55) synthase TruB [Calditrichota bacterium]
MQVLDKTSLDTLKLINFQRGLAINLNKPPGWTSFQVVKAVRRLVKTKVGHAGTLDPFATGVLIVCTGNATKQINLFMDYEKEYLATLELGKITDTYDCTGVVLEEKKPPEVKLDQLQNVCEKFEGEINQVPPMYSAVKIRGTRLYKLARKGIIVEREPRKVRIKKIEIVSYDHPLVTLRVICSKGTYIRSLAHDIGKELGYGAHLKSLIRTRIGPYHIDNSLSIKEFEQAITY